jgi:hypothetical protein
MFRRMKRSFWATLEMFANDTIHLRNMNQEHWSIYSRTSAFIQSYYLNDDLQFIDVRAFNDASSVVYI